MGETPLGFALGIRPNIDGDGKITGFDIQSENKGLSDEVVITLLRNWLRAVEDNYYAKFTGKKN